MKLLLSLCGLLLLASCQKEESGPEFEGRSEGPLVATVRETILNERFEIDYTYDAKRRIVGVKRYKLDVDDTRSAMTTVTVTYAPGRVRIVETNPQYEGIVKTDVRLGSNGLLASATRNYIYIQDQSRQRIIQTEAEETLGACYDAEDRLAICSYNGNISRDKWNISPEDHQKELYEKLLQTVRRILTFDRSEESVLYKKIKGEFAQIYYIYGKEEPEQRNTTDLTQELHLTPYRNSTNIDFTESNHESPSFPAPFASTRFLVELGLLGEICPYVPQRQDKSIFLSEFNDEGLLKKVSYYFNPFATSPSVVWEFTYVK